MAPPRAGGPRGGRSAGASGARPRPRAPADHRDDARRERGAPGATSSTTPGFARLRDRGHPDRAHREPADRVAARCRAPAPSRTSTRCARSRGCSRGRRRASTSRGGSALGTGLEAVAADARRPRPSSGGCTGRGRSSRCCSRTPRSRSRRPTAGSPTRALARAERPDIAAAIMGEWDRTEAPDPRRSPASDRLLASRPGLRASIDLRAPYVDALSYLQLRAPRTTAASSRPRSAGIAAGLQNTG